MQRKNNYFIVVGKGKDKPFKVDASRNSDNTIDNTINNPNTLFDDVSTKKSTTTQYPFEQWGANNNLPYKIVKWVIDSPLLPPLLETKVNMLLGGGLITYEIVGNEKDGTPIKKFLQDEEINNWIEQNEINEVLQKITTDFYYFGNYFVEFIGSRDSKIITNVNHIDATTARPNIDRKGFTLNPDFNNYKSTNNITIDKFNNSVVDKSIYQGLKYFPSNSYYGVPSWLGASKFIEYLNEIPNFKKSLIGNITAPSWLVTIPQEYFNVLFPDDTPEEQTKKYEQLCDDIDEFLQGSENAGKPLITRTVRNDKGQEVSITIQPLENKTPDGLFSDDFQQMFEVMSSSTQVPPSIASMLVPGKLSSGSDILNSWNSYNARIEPERNIILKFLYKIKFVNKWNPNIKFGFLNKELKVLNQNPTGQQTQIQ